MKRDPITAAWIRNRSDELAVENGCSFDVERGCYAAWWVERYCRLYEGEDAGKPLLLWGCHECQPEPCLDDWEDDKGQPIASTIRQCIERAAKHCRCVLAGHHIDWQYEFFMRLFGWVRWSERWQRMVRRFRKASVWVAKKQKKSPSLAALGLLLTCGDGEPGQKVFLGAKDGLQAKEIAGKHAIEMLHLSPELSAVCSVNKMFGQITHEPSRSIFRPMSSSNSRTQQSKEGLNGSVLIDETHVVDREFIGRISRAGISRSEPIHAEFSTAGDEPDDYGGEQFNRAQRVISGEVEDQELFAMVYAAPQDVSDEELDSDPLKYGRMANPAMGHTIDPEEFLSDYRSSRTGTVEEFARCKMYRFNIWQRGANPWIRATDWGRCRADYDLDDMAGRTCAVGLDLAKVHDTTALVLVFPPVVDGEPYRLWPYFWLPEETARDLASKVSYLDWERNGHIAFTPGDWLDYEVVRATLNDAKKKFNVTKVVYDPKFSDQLVASMIREDNWETEDFVPFGQSEANYTSPSEEFEKLILSQQIEHPGNAVLTWQAGHVVCPQNPRTRTRRPARPKRGDPRTIDGIVAAIMGLSAAVNIEDWYTPGCLKD